MDQHCAASGQIEDTEPRSDFTLFNQSQLFITIIVTNLFTITAILINISSPIHHPPWSDDPCCYFWSPSPSLWSPSSPSTHWWSSPSPSLLDDHHHHHHHLITIKILSDLITPTATYGHQPLGPIPPYSPVCIKDNQRWKMLESFPFIDSFEKIWNLSSSQSYY